MAIAACPRYLRAMTDGTENHQFYLSAPPGHRFLLYFPVWGENAESRQIDWSVSDRVQRMKRPRDGARAPSGWETISNKQFACAVSAGQRPPHDDERPRQRVPAPDNGPAEWGKALHALTSRQSALAEPLAAQGRLLTLDAVATAPFTTGLGNEHPLENGFAFLNPYGLPYLPGSGVKGVLRQAARELSEGDWGDAQGWSEDAITHLFGLEADKGGTIHQRGALTFWDVLPKLKDDKLQVEVMTPHQSHYYQPPRNGRQDDRSGGSTSPHDSGQPNPILFLTVPPESSFAFHIQCDMALLHRHAPALANGEQWQVLLKAALAHAFTWLGFGAKTAVGYGAMRHDTKAAERRKQDLDQRKERDAQAARAVARAGMSAEDRAWDEAQPVVRDFRAGLARAQAAGKFNPGGPFSEVRLKFMKTAESWTESRSRNAAADALAESATKDWGQPTKKERRDELQAAIARLRAPLNGQA